MHPVLREPHARCHHAPWSRADGHETDDFSLALSVPAAVQMRHLAMAYALRAALPGDPLWEDPLAATEGAVDVKEALKRTVIGRLEVCALLRPARAPACSLTALSLLYYLVH